MQIQVDIAFEELVNMARQLPETQWKLLKNEVEKKHENGTNDSDLEQFLLEAPTFNKKQLDEISQTRKAISKWRAA